MKIKLKQKIRNIIIVLLSISIIACGVMIYKTFNATEEKTNITTLYSYDCEPIVNYNITLLENTVYPNLTMEEDQTYISKLLDYITLNLGVNYNGSETFPMDIEYQVDAIVIGQQTTTPQTAEQKSEFKGISWSKVFPIIERQTIHTTNSNWEKSNLLKFNLVEYEAFAKEAIEATGLNLSQQLNISMTGSMTIKTSYEVITVPINSSIQLPLLDETFTVTKSDTSLVQNSITSTKTTTIPKANNKIFILIYGIIMALSISGIPYLILFCIEPTNQDLIDKKIKHIIKNYSNRLVALEYIKIREYTQIYNVQSINDLIKVADEIEKPVYYQHDKDRIVHFGQFFVQDINSLYIYSVDMPDECPAEATII